MKKTYFLGIQTALFCVLAILPSVCAMEYNVILSEDGRLIAQAPGNIIDITVLDALQRIAPNTEDTFFLQQHGIADKIIEALCVAGPILGGVIIQSSYEQDLTEIEYGTRHLANIFCEYVLASPVERGLTPIVEIKVTKAFEEWLSCEDTKSQEQIRERLDRIKYAADFTECHDSGDGVFKIRFNAGRRLYFIKLALNVIQLLEGGGKNGQNKQITRLRLKKKKEQVEKAMQAAKDKKAAKWKK